MKITSRNEKAASLVEYALLVLLIALICLEAIQTVGTSVSTEFSKIGSELEGAT